MKRLKITIIVLIVVALLGIGGYYYINKTKTNNNKNEVNNNQTNENTDTENTEEIYKDVINNYKQAKDEFEKDDTLAVEEKYPLVSEALILHAVRYKENNVELAYTYYDIDNNGTKELILGIKSTDSNKLIPTAIYTHTSNSEVKKLYYQNTIERGNLSIYDNGTLYSIGSGGAALHYYGFYKIASDGTSLETLENIREEYTTDNIAKYYNEDTNKELSYKNSDEITEKYINTAKEVELTTTATIN